VASTAPSRVRFYATGAPPWWRFQLVSMAKGRPGLSRRRFYSVLVDNGMFQFYTAGSRPPLDRWLAQLHIYATRLARQLDPAELIVILPDWVHDPDFTLKAAATPIARRICQSYTCYAAAHADTSSMMGYARTAEQLASLDHIHGLAAPAKLPCARTRTSTGRTVVSEACQAAVTQQVCTVARNHGLPCHVLGAKLSPRHLLRLAASGMTSFDTTSWTRPNDQTIAQEIGRWSAKTREEREKMFRYVIDKLRSHGIQLDE